MSCSVLWRKCRQKKEFDTLKAFDTSLNRCLKTSDLLLFGIGHMVGAAIYILTGIVAKDEAGPGVFLCYIISALAASLSAACYAEFSTKLPKCGSSYNYTYSVMGELAGFMIGWNTLAEYLFVSSLLSVGWVSIFDAATGDLISTGLTDAFPWWPQIEGLNTYPNLPASAICLIVTLFVALGVSFSVRLNNCLTVINASTVVFVIVVGLTKVDFTNWFGLSGGFFPYGISGVFKGSATVFVTFATFEAISIAAEETIDPAKSTPRALYGSLSITTILYVLAASALTLMIPYYDIDTSSPYAEAFESVGLYWASVVVSIGSLIGVVNCLWAEMFCSPRILFAMATDGVFFKRFSSINNTTQTPIFGSIVCGLVCAILALEVPYVELARFVSIGTLITYVFTAIDVLILRYSPNSLYLFASDGLASNQDDSRKGTLKSQVADQPVIRNFSQAILFRCAILANVVFSAIMGSILSYGTLEQAWEFVIWAVCFIGALSSILFLFAFERNDNICGYATPFVPLIPGLSISVNTILILQMTTESWIREIVWLLIGLVIYVAYTLCCRVEREQDKIQLLAQEDEKKSRYESSGPMYGANGKSPE